MKKICILLLVTAISFASVAQKKFTFPKLSRDVKKETKRYEKDGWQVFPGNQPLGQQLDNAFRKQAETDEQGFPKWIIANGSSVAQTEAAATMQATELAKINLVSLIESNMKSVVESDVSNNQLNKDDATSITKTIQVATNTVSKKLGLVQPLFKIYREIKKNMEVQMMLAYNYDQVRKQILDEMQLQLQKETDDVRKKYEDFLKPEKYKVGEIKNFYDQPAQSK